MNAYPDVVATIIRDYFERVNVRLRMVPEPDRQEFLKELDSHIYEGYHRQLEQEPVARILAVLRNLGEPAEVVCDRLPESMVRSGANRKLPLRLVAGLLIALFGLPLGFGGVAVVAGILLTLAGMLLAYYAVTGAILLTGSVFVLLGLTRIYTTDIWDGLVAIGLIRFDGRVGDYLNQLAPGSQGLLMLLAGAAFVVTGLGLLWLGKHIVRGTRFLFNLAFDGLRRAAQSIRRPFASGSRAPRQGGVAAAVPNPGASA